ncbi:MULTISPECIES: methionine ABC transporter permease [Acetoanaerobium]|uniref:DL-methionine transporter subunit membrane component protein of ABC superfamily n=1 Tax=Acetoanaerobium sticklandii (strain ATCC 12662 / DSM 519 / JCM 1433 / CCUG 9281 / NCIMB 10654 / HF) TaxID=499177 RepID=E3PSB7_ACESD|nr:methionine ABC transporter permease [Acetoanaerobium sticklandii]MBP9562812.1 ABC transporter permease [Acetoanaerobium sp.]CBH21771.1 DL-methionine transporter subunit; membrane component protein of ABC superfamily [Acetoanaerobium sticklandii]
MIELLDLLIPSINETLYMVFISTVFTVILGLPLGILLVITREDSVLPNSNIYNSLSILINITRSIPFVILMIFIIPFTRLVVGSSIGTNAAIVPLVVAAIPFFARLVEGSILEVNPGVIEAGVSMGASPLEIVLKILIPEAMPSLVLNVTVTIINIIGYSAMAGAVGGGGLGYLAIGYGYHRFQTDVMFATVIILIILVQLIQISGNKISNSIYRK